MKNKWSSSRYLCTNNECCCLKDCLVLGKSVIFITGCVWRWMFADVGMRCGGWEDAYFKGQVGVECGVWMVNDLCLFGWFLCLCHPYIPRTFMKCFYFTCVCPFFYTAWEASGCTWTKMDMAVVVNTFRDPNPAQRCANPSHTLHHSEGCGLTNVHRWRLYSSQAISGPWKNPSKSGVEE